MTTPDKSPISNKIKKYVNQIARLAEGDVRKQLFNLVGLIENHIALEEAEYGELKQSPRWVKASERLPEGSTSFGTMSKFVAVRYYDSLYKETMTGSGRYCHDRRKWYVSGWENGEVIEWLDESESPKEEAVEEKPISQQLKEIWHPQNISVEMMRTDDDIKEWEMLRDLFNEKTGVPKAERGLRYLNCFIEGYKAALQSPKQSDAVEFARWLADACYLQQYPDEPMWIKTDEFERKSTEQLYNLFKQTKCKR